MTCRNKQLFEEAVKRCQSRFGGSMGWQALGPDIRAAFLAKELFNLVAAAADNDDVSAVAIRQRVTALNDLFIEWSGGHE